MCSGSQTELYFENIPFVSEEDLEFVFDVPGSNSVSASRSHNLSRSEQVTPMVQPTRPIKIAMRTRAPRLLHGRSPLGLSTPILAGDIAVVARPARILQLISEDFRATHPLTQTIRGRSATAASWKTLKVQPPVVLPSPSIARIHSQRRKHQTETPLARSLFKDFQRKFYRRRVVELALESGISRRFDVAIRRKPVPST